MSKYYDGSDKNNGQTRKGTKKNTALKIIKGIGSALGLVAVALGGVSGVKKFNNKG